MALLEASRVELERYLEKMHTDAKRHEPMSIPSGIPPINPPEYQMEVCAPKKEVEQAMRKARATSSPGPNGVWIRGWNNGRMHHFSTGFYHVNGSNH